MPNWEEKIGYRITETALGFLSLRGCFKRRWGICLTGICTDRGGAETNGFIQGIGERL